MEAKAKAARAYVIGAPHLVLPHAMAQHLAYPALAVSMCYLLAGAGPQPR